MRSKPASSGGLPISARAPGNTPSLEDRLKQKIKTLGPITVAAFMEAALTDPDQGYYQQRPPFGAGGDFITSPEICQIFGELIGLWAAEVWRAMGAPGMFRFVELGPGRGTLMSDALRALKVVPEALDAAKVHFVESSLRLRAEQRRRLAATSASPIWHDKLAEVPAGPAIIIANEFVDALPVHQFVRRKSGWHERCVGLRAGGGFAFTERQTPIAGPERFIAGELRSAEIGSIVETRPRADDLISEIAARARQEATAALIIDYGHIRSGAGETLQAVRDHQPAAPLQAPGRSDLTAHVDFAALSRSAVNEGLAVHGPISQGRFLLALGLAERTERLMASATPEQAALLSSGVRRLVDPGEMGDLYKVLAATDPAGPPPPAFPSP